MSKKSPKETENLFNAILKASVSGNPKPKAKYKAIGESSFPEEGDIIRRVKKGQAIYYRVDERKELNSSNNFSYTLRQLDENLNDENQPHFLTNLHELREDGSYEEEA